MHDQVNIKRFSYHLHCLKIVYRYRYDQDTIFIIIHRLNFRQIFTYLFIQLFGHVDDTLTICARSEYGNLNHLRTHENFQKQILHA
jgi:hypothetical protein